MKKPLPCSKYINSNRGFIFPYVVFLATIVIIVVSGSITVYSKHGEMTEFLDEQLKLKSLLQMGVEQIREDYQQSNYDFSVKKQIVYNFPYGNASLTTLPLSDHELNVQFLVTTDKGSKKGATYIITK